MVAPHPFLDHPLPLAFAHRGGSLEAEENTDVAFAHATALGYSHVETDVQATRDGVAVIFHDDTLTRMTGEDVRVDALTWAELKTRRTKGGNAIPRLDEVLASWPGVFFNLEAKADPAVAPIAEAIKAAGAFARLCRKFCCPAHGRGGAASRPRPSLVAGAGGRAHALAARLGLAGGGARFPRGAGAAPPQRHPRGHPALRARCPCGRGPGSCLDGG